MFCLQAVISQENTNPTENVKLKDGVRMTRNALSTVTNNSHLPRVRNPVSCKTIAVDYAFCVSNSLNRLSILNIEN